MIVVTEEYRRVHATWELLSRDGYVGMTNAVAIVAAAGNTDDGRRALAEILSDDAKAVIIAPDALSYLRISRDVPLPPGVEDQRVDAYFRTNFYTGTRLSKTHQISVAKEYLYFNMAIGMITGTIDNVSAVREWMEGSGYDAVMARMPGGAEKAIGTIMVNEFRDSTLMPYNELIYIVTAVPSDAPESAKRVDYVNGYSLQTPLDRGATLYMFKLWLNKLRPIDAGNDFLGTNKELGSLLFDDTQDGSRGFRTVDKDGKWLVCGTIPRAISPSKAELGLSAYREAAEHAGTVVPATTEASYPVASRPDADHGKPASKWGFTVDWRRPVLQAAAPAVFDLSYGDSEWGQRLAGYGFTPGLAFYGASCVGRIHMQIGDCPYPAAGTSHAS